MTLIDRDAYKQELEKAIYRCLRMTGRPDPVVLMTLQYAIAKLDSAPVAEAVPVRHGKWIEDGSFKYKHGGRNSDVKELFGTEWRTMRRIKCSLCNKITLVDETILYEYCPHCGAKMGD